MEAKIAKFVSSSADIAWRWLPITRFSEEDAEAGTRAC